MMSAVWRARLQRLRVPLGFACFAIGIPIAHPTTSSLIAGGVVTIIGEAVRVWASGHLEKSREVTRSGPYRWVRHPLYLGSAIIGVGFMLATRNVWVVAMVSAYLVATLVAAMRGEEAHLDEKFEGQYSTYREGKAAPVDRSFSLSRVTANQEYRAIAGLVLGMGLLYLRSRL